jgi:hypothetical protein
MLRIFSTGLGRIIQISDNFNQINSLETVVNSAQRTILARYARPGQSFCTFFVTRRPRHATIAQH